MAPGERQSGQSIGATVTSFRTARASGASSVVNAGDGCVLVGSTGNPAMYAQEWPAAVPFAFRVEGGDELRAAVATVAARFAAALAPREG